MIQNVLIIDDDEVSAFITRHQIIKFGLAENVMILHSAVQAVGYFESLMADKERPSPELIILDISMPQMNGWEFLEAFSQRFTAHFLSIRICILTSLEVKDGIKTPIHPCVISFANKPLTQKALEGMKKAIALDKAMKKYPC